MNIWCEFGKDRLKTKGCRAHTRKINLPPSGQKWNYRALKITWHLGLSLRNIWCEFDKDQLKTLGCTVYTRNKRIWSCGGHKWNRKSIGLSSLIQCIFGVILKKIGWKLRSPECPQENPFWSPYGHKWNCRVPNIDWCLDFGTRDMWPEGLDENCKV